MGLTPLTEAILDWTDGLKAWLKVEPISAHMRGLVQSYRSSGNLFDADLLDEFLSQQPNVLCLTTLMLMFAAFLFLCCAFTCLAKPIVKKRKHTEHFQYPPKKTWLLTLQLFVYACTWAILVGCILLVVSFTIQLKSRYDLLEKEQAVSKELIFHNGSASEKYVIIAMDTISIHEKERVRKFEDFEQLQKFNELRELGYDFKPIETDFIHRVETTIFMFIILIYSICFLSSIFAVICGCYKFLMGIYSDEQSSKYVEYILVGTSTVCFLLAPFAILLAAILILYSCLHDVLCPILQLETQNQNMEDYVNLYHDYFDSNHLISFFNDLLEERIPLNVENCANFMKPMQGLWLILIIESMLSLLWAFISTRLSKTLRRNNKTVFYSSETYSTIPEKSKPPSIHSFFMPKY